MKKEIQTALIVALALALCFAGCRKQTGHTCKFNLCPYKGYTSFPGVINTGETTINYEEEPGSDAWALDQLHFEYPNVSYGELEEKLFTTKK